MAKSEKSYCKVYRALSGRACYYTSFKILIKTCYGLLCFILPHNQLRQLRDDGMLHVHLPPQVGMHILARHVHFVQQLRTLVSGRYPGKPYYVLGHSLGSILVRAMLIRYGEGLDGAVLCGTGQQSESLIRPLKLFCAAEIRRRGREFRSDDLYAKLLRRFSRPFGKDCSPYAWLSRDPDTVHGFENDPMCGAVPSVGLIYDVLCGMEYVSLQKNRNRMRRSVPVIFISGDCDPFGENGKGVIRAYKGFLKAGLTDVTLKLYHGGRHEILNETNREEVYLDLLGWLNKNAGVI